MTTKPTVGWIGAGRMGYQLAKRLLDAGYDVAVYNRTKSKAEPLMEFGATVVDRPVELAGRDIVFSMVAADKDLEHVMLGDGGLLTDPDRAPRVVGDASTVSEEASERVRVRAEERQVGFLATPVSGNPAVIASGKLTVAVSGPRDAYEEAAPLLDTWGRGVTYVGEGEVARIVKIAHNVFLGVVIQSMAEITVLAEKAGVKRADFLSFLNDSVMGSTFTRYKTPAFVNLDYTPTFTWHLLRKDFELGLQSGRDLDVPLPASALVHQMVIDGIGRGWGDQDFAALLTRLAEGAGLSIEPENREVSDGLS